MSRIRETFASLKRAARGGFIPFITAGDPDLTTTERLLIELAAAGANIIELGVPFSDPVADGETIQRASERALRKGVTLRDALTCIARAKQHIDVPIVLFSYFNPLLNFGRDRLTDDAEALVKRVRSVSDLPVAVGFGISTAEQVREVLRFADAAVIGSAIVSQIEELAESPDLVRRVGEFARSLLAPKSNDSHQQGTLPSPARR